MARTLPGPVDVAIVGSGPAGLYALFHAGFLGLSAALFESHVLLGGQLAVLYPGVELNLGPDLPRALARDRMRGIREQALQFEARVVTRGRVRDLRDLRDGDLELSTAAGRFRARHVLLATGAGALLPESGGRGGRNILRTRLDDPGAYAGRRVLVYGSTAEDADALLSLSERCAALVVAQPRGVIPGMDGERMNRLLERAEFLPHSRLVRADEAGDGTLRVSLQRGHLSWTTETRDADALLLANAHLSDLRAATEWGIAMRGPGFLVDGTGRTSRPRIFACGDAAMHDAKEYTLARTHEEASRAVATIASLLGAPPSPAAREDAEGEGRP